jgi:REP element-mobilizing transposase RayT
MTNIRRYWEFGSPCFMTHVTFDRKPLLIDNIDLWHKSIAFAKSLKLFNNIAWVILPDHLHLMIDFSVGDPS